MEQGNNGKLRVLVTGSGGFNGRYIMELLKKCGHEVRATDLAFGERVSTRSVYDELEVEFHPADLTKKETLYPVLKDIDFVMHTASLFDYRASLEENRRVNVGGMRNLCEAMLESGAGSLILWSTVGVYGPPDPKRLPATETHPARPATPYDKSKLEQEEAALDFHRREKLRVAVLRPAPVYGPRNRYGFYNVVKPFKRAPIIPVLHNLNKFMPFVHVEDVAGAAGHLMNVDEAMQGQVFNVADDSRIRVKDFMRLMGAYLQKDTLNLWLPLKTRHLEKAARLLAKAAELESRYITKQRPRIEQDTIDYIAHDFIYSNDKLKSMGYKLKFPDARVGLIGTIDWFRQEGMV